MTRNACYVLIGCAAFVAAVLITPDRWEPPPKPSRAASAPERPQQDLSLDLRVATAFAIRNAGFRCREVVYSRSDRPTVRGDQWEIQCDEHLYRYRVIVSDHGGVLVTPW
jgi:hypothetical protein